MGSKNERPTRVQVLRAKLDEAIPYDIRPLWREFLVALDAEAIENGTAGSDDEARQVSRAPATRA
jgi:hypothetical protein